jgi:hypothetical protein
MNRDIDAGGSNNSPTQTALVRILDSMNINQQSVFLDAGSGFGIPCIAANLLYNCTSIGVDFDHSLVVKAGQVAYSCGAICQFYHMNIRHLTPAWLHHRGVTHIYAFDKVILPQTWNVYIDNIIQYATMGTLTHITSCFRRNWPFEQITQFSFKMSGKGASHHTMYTFSVESDENDESTESDENDESSDEKNDENTDSDEKNDESSDENTDSDESDMSDLVQELDHNGNLIIDLTKT